MPVSLSGRGRAALLRGTVAVCGGALLAVLAVLPVSAHAVKNVGTYTLAVGWSKEPAYVGFDNAAEVIVNDAAGKPVNDLKAGDLKVQVGVGDQKSDTKDLEPGFDPDIVAGTPGEYHAQLIPTAPGTYTFHVTGSVHGTAVDQTVTASDQTFAVVTEPSDDMFPTKLPSTSALSTKVDQIDARVDAAARAASDASSAASTATTIAIAALVGAAALVGRTVGLALRRRA